MTRKLIAIIICISMLFATLACQLLSSSNLPAEPTQTSVPANTDTPEIIPTATQDAAATAQAELDQQIATEEARAQAATQAAASQATEAAAQIVGRTATAEGKVTAQANDMYQLVEKLRTDGVLDSTSGQYYPIGDFKESWAQINWYQWWNTGYQPADFVIRTHTEWESASRTPNTFASGCGFVFRATDEKNHYMIFLALDGNVYMRGYVNGKYRTFGKGYAGKQEIVQGEADIVLIAQGGRFAYYVNGAKVFTANNSELVQGDLGLTLNSGTNKDYGTRCTMTNTELWVLDD